MAEDEAPPEGKPKKEKIPKEPLDKTLPMPKKAMILFYGCGFGGILLAVALCILWFFIPMFYKRKLIKQALRTGADEKRYSKPQSQLMFFVAICFIKVLAWESAFPTYLSGLILKEGLRYVIFFALVISGSFASYFGSYNMLINTKIINLAYVTATVFVFTILMPTLYPRWAVQDLHHILRAGNLVFWALFTIMQPMDWYDFHLYYYGRVGVEETHYMGTYLYGLCIYLILCIVQLLESCSAYYIKRQVPRVDPIVPCAILFFTSSVFCFLNTVSFYGVCNTCESLQSRNTSRMHTPCWFHDHKKVLTVGTMKGHLYENPDFLYHYLQYRIRDEHNTSYFFHKPQNYAEYPYLVSLSWTACNTANPYEVYKHPTCVGIFTDRGTIETAMSCFETEYLPMIYAGMDAPAPYYWFVEFFNLVYRIGATSSTFGTGRDIAKMEWFAATQIRNYVVLTLPPIIIEALGRKTIKQKHEDGKRYHWAKRYVRSIHTPLYIGQNLTMLAMYRNKVVTIITRLIKWESCVDLVNRRLHLEQIVMPNDKVWMRCTQKYDGLPCYALNGSPLIYYLDVVANKTESIKSKSVPHVVGHFISEKYAKKLIDLCVFHYDDPSYTKPELDYPTTNEAVEAERRSVRFS